MNDLRFALRQLAKSPGFTLVASLSLALGIGTNSVVFCWLQETLLRPLPGVHRAEEMVALCTTHGAEQWDTVSLPDLHDYGQLTDIFAGVIGSQVTPACLTVDQHAGWVYGQIVTANFFEVLGVRPILGRTFLAEEDLRPGGAPVLVLSESYWQRRFQGDPGVLGQVVDLNRHSFTIVGVVPARFRGTMSGLRCDFWAPLTMHRQVANFGSLDARGDHWLHTQARLRPGVSRAQAQAAVDTLAQQLAREYPDTNRELGLRILPMWKTPYGGQALLLPVLSLLLAVSAGVLLIVAANVANLLLARATLRQKELAIRQALGAGRARLLRQLLTESLLLAAMGGVLGILAAFWGARLFQFFLPPTHLPIGYDFSVEGGTLLFTAALTLSTGILFGLAPALQTSRLNLSAELKEGGRTSGGALPHHRLRNTLVVAEMALALMLLAGAGLCLKGSRHARHVDIGFDPQQVLLAGLRVGMHGYDEPRGLVFYRELRQRLGSIPGVREAALASWFPLGFEGGSGTVVEVPGYERKPTEDLSTQYAIVSPGYFSALGIPLVAGRDFTDEDDSTRTRAAIINQTMAEKYWPGLDPIGRKFLVWGGQRELTVVGVARDGKYRFLTEPRRPFIYFAYQQGVWDLNLGVVLRTEGDPLAFTRALRDAVQTLDPGVELWAVQAMTDYVEASFLGQRIVSTLLLGLGLVAAVLAAMGIYGVMAYIVNQRTHELGIRMALGATAGRILRLVLGQGLRLTLLGLGLGLAGAVCLTHLLRNFLHGVSPIDPATFLTVSALLALVSLAACAAPAWRAARVEPMIALRQD